MKKILGRDLKEIFINELKKKKSLYCYTKNDETYDEDYFAIKADNIYFDGAKLDVWAYGYETYIDGLNEVQITKPSYLTFKETDETYEKLIEKIVVYDVDVEDYTTIENDKYYNFEFDSLIGALAIQTCEK